MSILTWILLAFLCGLFAGKLLDLFKTLLVKLRHIRLEIELGSDRDLVSQKQIAQGGVNSVTPEQAIRGARARPTLKQGRVSSKNTDGRPLP